jgi:glycerophosphoryl diester phosphodiesterase
VPRAFAVVVPPRDPAALLAETGCQILHCLSDLLTDGALKILADSGIEHAVAVVNDAARARHLLAAGAQSILTDIPDLLGSAARVRTS